VLTFESAQISGLEIANNRTVYRYSAIPWGKGGLFCFVILKIPPTIQLNVFHDSTTSTQKPKINRLSIRNEFQIETHDPE